MDRGVVIGIGVAAIFGLLPFAVRSMPGWLAWGGIFAGVAIIVCALVPKAALPPVGPLLLYALGILAIYAGVVWQMSSSGNPLRSPSQIALRSVPAATADQTGAATVAAKATIETKGTLTNFANDPVNPGKKSKFVAASTAPSAPPAVENQLRLHAETAPQASLGLKLIRKHPDDVPALPRNVNVTDSPGSIIAPTGGNNTVNNFGPPPPRVEMVSDVRPVGSVGKGTTQWAYTFRVIGTPDKVVVAIRGEAIGDYNVNPLDQGTVQFGTRLVDGAVYLIISAPRGRYQVVVNTPDDKAPEITTTMGQ